MQSFCTQSEEAKKLAKRQKKAGPSFGVVGFTRQVEVEEALQAIPDQPTRRLEIGVHACCNTLEGRPFDGGVRFPRKRYLPYLFRSDPRLLNMLHYDAWAEGNARMCKMMREACELCGPALDGIQINACWPSNDVVEMLRGAQPDLFIRLRINQSSIDMADNLDHVVNIVGGYLPWLDGVVLDLGQLGTMEDGTWPYLQALSKVGGLDIGVSGDLDACNLAGVGHKLVSFPQLSFVTEAKLLSGNGLLHMPKVRDYIKEGFALCRKTDGTAKAA